VIAGIAPKFDRQGLPRTILVLRIFDVVKDKELYASTPLSSLLVGSALQAGAAVDDPSSALIDEVMKFVDENLRLTEMRRISREAALRRAAAVTSQKYPNPLPVLMELRYYQWKELLTSEELAQHYTKLIGDDGQRLATGTEAQRRLVIEQFLPRE